MATFPYSGFLDGVGYAAIPTGTTTINVNSSASLTTALTNATAGQRIVLASATYAGSFTLAKQGTATAGITIEAAVQGGAVFAAGSTITVNNAAYVTFKGLTFPYELTSGGNIIGFRGTSNRCRVTRSTFGPATLSTSTFTTKSTFVYMGDDTDHIRVDHNEIRNKTTPGNAVLGDGNFTTFQVVRHMRWDHNIVRGIKPEVANEKEPFRLGVSTMSKTMSYSVIERNFFTDCIAEPEIVSVKAGGVRVSGNTVLRCIGGLVYRHGTNGLMADNYIVDTGVSGGGGGEPSGILSTAITSIVALTQAQYDALGTKDPHTLYYTTTGSSAPSSAKQVASTSITKIVALTSSQYNALATKDGGTLYLVMGLVPSTVTSSAVTSTTVDTIVQLSQSAYNALGSPNPRTIYIIAG